MYELSMCVYVQYTHCIRIYASIQKKQRNGIKSYKMYTKVSMYYI